MNSSNFSPEILSMETSTRDDSHLRIRYGDVVKYVIIAPGTLSSDELCLPLHAIPTLPYHDSAWNTARINRNKETQAELQFSLEHRSLAGVTDIWHSELIDCLGLERVELLTMNTFSCVRKDQLQGPTMIAKVARFSWEIPRLEQETHIYRLLQHTGITARFLGHIHEEGRVIGMLLEKLEGSFASIEDLANCEHTLGRLHSLGILHGDVNRHNFIVSKDGVKLIDFETCKETHDTTLLEAEMLRVASELQDESGRGAGFMTDDEESD
ncbi:hypothetical protein CC79DRAFT_1365272 [Sarocladium strictum]